MIAPKGSPTRRAHHLGVVPRRPDPPDQRGAERQAGRHTGVAVQQELDGERDDGHGERPRREAIGGDGHPSHSLWGDCPEQDDGTWTVVLGDA